jgi:hypothetical protein
MTTQHATPTRQRIAQTKGRIDKPQRDFTAQRDFSRIVPAFELMERRGHITQDERRAGERYAAYWHGARRQRGLIGAYGDQRWSHTSGNQTLEEWPVHCATELHRAKLAIGDDRMSKILETMVEADATLQDVGRSVFPHMRSPGQAMAAGAAAVKIGLGLLARHFDRHRSRDRP